MPMDSLASTGCTRRSGQPHPRHTFFREFPEVPVLLPKIKRFTKAFVVKHALVEVVKNFINGGRQARASWHGDHR